MKRKQVHDGTHLTLEERKIIQTGIESNSTKADIARTIGKDATTIAKEIRKHRKLKARNHFNRPILCKNIGKCKVKPCLTKCAMYEEPKCNRRDKSPGACNKCEKTNKCNLDKYFYNATCADEEYKTDLVDFREGINLTTKERDSLAEIIAPLLKRGQSVYQILSAHHEIKQSSRTLYNYIEAGVFKEHDVDNFSLKEQVNRKFRAKYKKRKKRAQPINYNGREYKDFLAFREENPDVLITEMDTVYNHPSGPYLQTFLFEKTGFMVGFIHKERNNVSMASGVDSLQKQLGNNMFATLCSVLLTDRGSEFEKWEMFEQNPDGTSRLAIFYCDPMRSCQKPHVENNHNYIRDIIPNSYPMDKLSQKDIDVMFSHINSTPRRSLGGKSPYEVFSFLYGEKTATALNIINISRDDVTLKPCLIYAKRVTA